MPGEYGGYQSISPAFRRLIADTVTNVLAANPTPFMQSHAGGAMALRGWSGGKAKGKGKTRSNYGEGGGKGARQLDQAPCWQCLACGEPNNYPRRDSCYKCRAPRGSKATNKTKGKGKGKQREGTVGKGLSNPPPQALRPSWDRGQGGAIGADGQRPIFKFIAEEARERAKGDPTKSKGEGGDTARMDSEGFRVVARAAGVWPRVGGTDVGGGRVDGGTAGKSGPKGGETADAPCGSEVGQGKGAKGPRPQEKGVGGKGGKGAPMPNRPPWADQEDDDIDDGVHGDDGWDEDLDLDHDDEPGEQMDDEDMGEQYEEEEEYWEEDGPPEQEEGDGHGEVEQEPELEVLRQRWQNKKDVYEAVAWSYWKGQPQYEDAKAEKDRAYEEWQSAKRAQATPKLATLYQRRQRTLDRARRKLERTMHDADEELRQHEERMLKYQEQMRQDQLRIDEADASLREVARRVAASTGAGGEGDEDSPPNGMEARDRAEGARKGLESAQAKLQELHDKLEEQGNFTACEQLNLLYGAIAGAAGNIEGVEQLLVRPRPKQQQRRAEYYAMDPGTDDASAEKGEARSTTGVGERSATKCGASPKATMGTNRWDSKPRARGKDDGTTVQGTAAGQAAENSEERQRGRAGSASTSGAAPSRAATGNEAGATPTVIRFGGAGSEDQERELLRSEAVQALEQARAKFQDAERSQDTDKAALLYAHQLILGNIGVPTTLEQREAYERWRGALGENLEKVAAERLADGGSLW